MCTYNLLFKKKKEIGYDSTQFIVLKKAFLKIKILAIIFFLLFHIFWQK